MMDESSFKGRWWTVAWPFIGQGFLFGLCFLSFLMWNYQEYGSDNQESVNYAVLKSMILKFKVLYHYSCIMAISLHKTYYIPKKVSKHNSVFGENHDELRSVRMTGENTSKDSKERLVEGFGSVRSRTFQQTQ